MQLLIRLLRIRQKLAISLLNLRSPHRRAKPADIAEQLKMVQPDAERFAAAHRKTGNRPVIPIRVRTIMRFDKKKVRFLPWYSFGISTGPPMVAPNRLGSGKQWNSEWTDLRIGR